MKTIKILLLAIILIGSTVKVYAQETDGGTLAAILKTDDAESLGQVVTKDNVNTCLGPYSLLSHAVRYNAKECFDLLLEKGADVNKICDDYIPPLMHAAKYGRLEMAKILVAKGADIHFQYKGPVKSIQGMTPLTYAEKYQQKEVADYLRSLK